MVRELGGYKEEFFTGAATQPVLESVEGLVAGDVVRRLWAIDPGLFTHDADSAKGIPQRMGWLRAPEFMGAQASGLRTYARQVYDQGLRKAVVLAIGGTAASARAFVRCFGRADGFVDVRLIDDVEPTLVREVAEWAEPRNTLVVVSAKEGDSVELTSLEAYLWERMRSELGNDAASRFCAVTDPESELQRVARRKHYGRVFENPPDMGERYTPISFYGLLPAALHGVDVASLVEDAKRMGDACSPAVAIEQNPGFKLGSFIVGLARAGRDKVTLLFSPEVQPFGEWIEHMVADSTAKRGRGIFPIFNEPLGSPEAYEKDRCFVYLKLARKKRTDCDELVDALVASGHPVARITLGDKTELGGEFFRWEVATALIASFLRVNPFDDPGLVASRSATSRFLDAHRRDSVLPPWRSTPPSSDATIELIKKLKQTDYLAFAAYFPRTDARDRLFSEMRRLLRTKFGISTAQGYGTPFLYSTGQLHKNGPSSTALLVLTAATKDDIAVPDQTYTFGVLRDAQVLGDLQLLEHGKRRVLRVHLADDIDAGLQNLRDKLLAM